jgi:phosphoribosylaminoimidazole carboxylase (NCAIR synthetase)
VVEGVDWGGGNFVVKSAEQLSEGVAALGGFGSVYAETWAPFVKELAVVVVRSRDFAGLACTITLSREASSYLGFTT